MTAAVPTTPDWPTCQRDPSCVGIRFDGHDSCLAHLDSKDRVAALSGRGSADLDLRGTTIDQPLPQLILGTRDHNGFATLGQTRCGLARFTGAITFDAVRFTGIADFSGATFDGPVSVNRVTFAAGAAFHGAEFTGEVSGSGNELVFDAATFAKPTVLSIRSAADVNLRTAHFTRWTGCSWCGGSRWRWRRGSPSVPWCFGTTERN